MTVSPASLTTSTSGTTASGNVVGAPVGMAGEDGTITIGGVTESTDSVTMVEDGSGPAPSEGAAPAPAASVEDAASADGKGNKGGKGGKGKGGKGNAGNDGDANASG